LRDAGVTRVSLGVQSLRDADLRARLRRAACDRRASLAPWSTTADAVARVLAAAARKLGTFDLVMTGRESGDWGAGQTGGLLAEELGLPCVSFVDAVERAGAGLRLRRQTDAGWEVFEAVPPVVVTVTNDEHNVPRIPKVRDVMMSYRQPLTKFTLADLGLAADGNDYYEVAELSIPQKETRCDFVSGDTLDEKVEAFAQRIVEVTRSM
jgi:electron transfer flavoprotein beta subunit